MYVGITKSSQLGLQQPPRHGCRTFGGCPLAADKWRWDIWRLENWRLRQMALETFGG